MEVRPCLIILKLLQKGHLQEVEAVSTFTHKILNIIDKTYQNYWSFIWNTLKKTMIYFNLDKIGYSEFYVMMI